jgi:hypothetical protein
MELGGTALTTEGLVIVQLIASEDKRHLLQPVKVKVCT